MSVHECAGFMWAHLHALPRPGRPRTTPSPTPSPRGGLALGSARSGTPSPRDTCVPCAGCHARGMHRAPRARRDVNTRSRIKDETRPRHEPTISSLQSPLVFAFRPALVARCTRMGLTHSSSRSLRLRCARPRARTRLPPPSRSTCACATARAHVRSHHHSRGGYQKPVRLRFCFFMALTSASCVSSKVRARFSRDSR